MFFAAEIIQGRKLFNGGNYYFLEVLTAETIQRRKVFKGGNYMMKYGMYIFLIFSARLVSCLDTFTWPVVLVLYPDQEL